MKKSIKLSLWAALIFVVGAFCGACVNNIKPQSATPQNIKQPSASPSPNVKRDKKPTGVDKLAINHPDNCYATGKAQPFFEISGRSYDYWPKVVRAGRAVRINVKLPPADIYFEIVGGADLQPNHKDGVYSATLKFFGEKEHTVLVRERFTPRDQPPLAELRIYSLRDDLYAMRPFKGDFHMHSNRSDGKDEPVQVAVAARKIGLDLIAITDHQKFAPSLEAIDAISKIPTELKVFTGEEVHAPKSNVHIVNFGSSFSVNELFSTREKLEVYAEEVSLRMQKLPHLNNNIKYQVASSEWVFDKINEGGGVSVLCHPFWRSENRLVVSYDITQSLMQRQNFDALEVIGGFYRFEQESNAKAIAMYNEFRAAGSKLNVLGNSDAHGCYADLFGWYYTVVFAKSDSFTDVAAAIKSQKSVSLEAVPGEFPRVIGSMRLVNLTYFLLREVFPLHDAVCLKEGKLMQAHFAKDTTALEKMRASKDDVKNLMRKYWMEETSR